MAFNWNPVYALNLVLCIIILILGFLGYRRNKNQVPLYISIAFGLFGISHLMALFRGEKNPESTLIIIRILAYLLVIVALYKAAFEANA